MMPAVATLYQDMNHVIGQTSIRQRPDLQVVFRQSDRMRPFTPSHLSHLQSGRGNCKPGICCKSTWRAVRGVQNRELCCARRERAALRRCHPRRSFDPLVGTIGRLHVSAFPVRTSCANINGRWLRQHQLRAVDHEKSQRPVSYPQ